MPFLRTLVFVAVVCPALLCAQTFSQHAARVESLTAGSMRLISATDDGTQIITANGKGYKLLTPAVAQDEQMVRSAVALWVGRYANDLFQLTNKAEFKEYQTERVGNLWQTSFALQYNDIPVRERYLKVNTGALSGSIMMIRSNVRNGVPNALLPQVTPEIIYEASLNEITGSLKQVGAVNLVYIDKGTVLQLAYEVVAGSPEHERWRLTYDALTGKLIEKKSLLLDRCFENDGIGEEAVYQSTASKTSAHQSPQAIAGGRITAMVHLSTPTDQLTEVGLPEMDIIVNGTTTRTDSLGFWSLPSVTYPLIINTGLQNSYMNVHTSGGSISTSNNSIVSGPGNVTWNDANSTQSERDAAYSLLRSRAHIKSIQPDLQNIDQPLTATVDYNATCNAFYDPDLREFTFFASSNTCNATAQVADVVYHEYGHRVNHCRYNNTDIHNMQDLSLNEGFADIYSALMRDDPRIGIGFYTDPAKVLRNCQNTRKWPTNIVSDPHVNGMIISGAFWDLRKATDLNTTQQLFHSMSRLTPDGSGAIDAQSLGIAFTNVLVATILADDDDNDLSNGTPHLEVILSSFEKHNITLASLLKLQVTPIADQNATAVNYPVTVEATYTGPVGALDETSVTVHYSTDGKSYTPLLLERSSDDIFEGSLPKVSPGSIIYYYASARTTRDDSNETPSKDEPLSFLVGFEQVFSDDFETNKNWIKSDSAASGRWERGDPYGTSFAGAESFPIQQDTDHTAVGTSCYVTGNSNTSSPSFDDVDNGYTRLTSPSLDLSKMDDPYIRFWYYYSNDMGQNPGLTDFVIEFSQDNVNWKEAFTTKMSTKGWQQMLIRVKDYITLSGNVQVRFVASDIIGCLVEAGVDDFEVLDPEEKESVSGNMSASGDRMTLEVYPQPVSTSEVRFHLTNMESNSLTLSLKDLLGVERLSTTFSNAENTMALHLPKALPNGIYMLEATTAGGSASAKVVITR
jgi:hypothetical protein